MKILNILNEGAIISELSATDKKGVLEELTAPLAQASGLDHEELVRVLLERERLGSTGIGDGIAIPHAKSKSLESLFMGFGRSRKGVDFEATDGRPAWWPPCVLTARSSRKIKKKSGDCDLHAMESSLDCC